MNADFISSTPEEASYHRIVANLASGDPKHIASSRYQLYIVAFQLDDIADPDDRRLDDTSGPPAVSKHG